LKITFNYRNTSFRIRKSEGHKLWISDLVATEGRIVERIDFVFTDDNDLKDINQEFLHHNYYTDVIAFDYSEQNKVRGEVYISIERVNSNAQTFNVSFSEELRRVMAHAVLHLCGYSDDEPEEREEMRELENVWLNNWRNGTYI
jgi:rRNA maturation RNase YbeY